MKALIPIDIGLLVVGLEWTEIGHFVLVCAAIRT
jgi:hypothetical protein